MRPTSTGTVSLLPFMVAGVLVLLALNLVHLVWEWWGSPTVQLPQKYSQQLPAAELGARRVDVPIFGHNLQFGESTAPATLIIFTDPACAPCRAQVARTLALAPNQSLRVVYKFWPRHPDEPSGGMITDIARREGLAIPFMRALEQHPAAEGDDLLAVLESAGLPLEKQQDWLKNKIGDLIATINQDIAQGESLQLAAPPQFILNGYVLDDATLPPSRLATYLQRVNAGQAIAQTDDYFLNP